jgi:hypothetical protein
VRFVALVSGNVGICKVPHIDTFSQKRTYEEVIVRHRDCVGANECVCVTFVRTQDVMEQGRPLLGVGGDDEKRQFDVRVVYAHASMCSCLSCCLRAAIGIEW